MKKVLAVLLIALFGIGIFLYLGFAAKAQHIYLGMYWIAGSVSDPDNQGTEGRKVVFYKERTDDGFSDDVVGAPGLAGQDGESIINAFEDWRMVITPGTYLVAIVNDNPDDMANGYGAGPVEITVTGKGYDTVNLELALGAGIGDPGERASAYAPQIDDVYFGNRKYQWELAETKGEDFEFVISTQPKISAKITAAAGLNTSSIFMVVREGSGEAMGEESISLGQASKVTASGPAALPTEVDFVIDYFNEGKTLPDGKGIPITFRASNAYGTTTRVARVDVFGGEAGVRGQILTFPSPLRFSAHGELTIQYVLTKDVNTNIYLVDVSGRIVKKFVNYARQEGGSAGLNKVTWNLVTDQGGRVASGIYVISLVNRENGKLLGKGKATFLP
jgi:hypothetical protein